MESKKVSICIPAYRPYFLYKCLRSVLWQIYRNIEVIVSDDCPTGLKYVCDQFPGLEIRYVKGVGGMPQNWNHAIKYATGDYFLLMHDDDEFASYDSVSKFVAAFDGRVDFVFGNGNIKRNCPNLYKNPQHLIWSNCIGVPSNVMVRNEFQHIRYNESLKWMVDVDYYMKLIFSGATYKHVRENLVYVGKHKAQQTNLIEDKIKSQEVGVMAYFLWGRNKFGVRLLEACVRAKVFNIPKWVVFPLTLWYRIENYLMRKI